jgi:hypothetical protein
LLTLPKPKGRDCKACCDQLVSAFGLCCCGVIFAIAFAICLPLSLNVDAEEPCGNQTGEDGAWACAPPTPPPPPLHPDARSWHSADAPFSFPVGLVAWLLAAPATLLCFPTFAGWARAQRTRDEEVGRTSKGVQDLEIGAAQRDLSLTTTGQLRRVCEYLVNVAWGVSLFGFSMALGAWRILMYPVYDGIPVDWRALFVTEGTLGGALLVWLVFGEWLRRKLETEIVRPAAERVAKLFTASQQHFYNDVTDRLADDSIRLVRCTYLAQHPVGVLPRCQELPEEAFLSAEEALQAYEKGLVFVISQCVASALVPARPLALLPPRPLALSPLAIDSPSRLAAREASERGERSARIAPLAVAGTRPSTRTPRGTSSGC